MYTKYVFTISRDRFYQQCILNMTMNISLLYVLEMCFSRNIHLGTFMVKLLKKVSEYNQEISQSQTADQRTTP